jgi:hypothetical protein
MPNRANIATHSRATTMITTKAADMARYRRALAVSVSRSARVGLTWDRPRRGSTWAGVLGRSEASRGHRGNSATAADAIMPRLSPSRSRVLILPTQEFGGMSVCRAGLRSGGRVRSRRRYRCRRSNYRLASSRSGIRRRPKGAVSCGSGDHRRHHHDCREASDQTHQGFILVRESPDCNIGASW